MTKHTCDSLVITCIDFRFQEIITSWLHKYLGHGQFDRVSVGGSIYDFYTVLKQVEISNRLHSISKVILMNHEDCGAYGVDGTYERHRLDLIEAERKIEALFPHLDVETYYIYLDGTFKEISRTNPRGKRT